MIRFFGAIGIALSAASVTAQDHGHLNIGAESKNLGSKLIFANGADFSTNSGYVKTLLFATNGNYSGYYQGNVTLTVLPATEAHGIPDPQAPALGSYIHAQITNVEAPDGGTFGWWETGATSPTSSLPPGGSILFRMTEADGSPGTDPYGHLHGRRFTATKPGIYKVTFRAHDLSTNGPELISLHTPSDEITIYFQAGVNLFDVRPETDGVHIRFATVLGSAWQLESSDSLGLDANWVTVGDTIVGNDLIAETLDDRPQATARFYRLKSIPL